MLVQERMGCSFKGAWAAVLPQGVLPEWGFPTSAGTQLQSWAML